MHFESMAITNETLCSHELSLQLFFFFWFKKLVLQLLVCWDPTQMIEYVIHFSRGAVGFFVFVSFCHK